MGMHRLFLRLHYDNEEMIQPGIDERYDSAGMFLLDIFQRHFPHDTFSPPYLYTSRTNINLYFLPISCRRTGANHSAFSGVFLFGSTTDQLLYYSIVTFMLQRVRKALTMNERVILAGW